MQGCPSGACPQSWAPGCWHSYHPLPRSPFPSTGCTCSAALLPSSPCIAGVAGQDPCTQSSSSPLSFPAWGLCAPSQAHRVKPQGSCRERPEGRGLRAEQLSACVQRPGLRLQPTPPPTGSPRLWTQNHKQCCRISCGCHRQGGRAGQFCTTAPVFQGFLGGGGAGIEGHQPSQIAGARA